jgi:hypothetical protein
MSANDVEEQPGYTYPPEIEARRLYFEQVRLIMTYYELAARYALPTNQQDKANLASDIFTLLRTLDGMQCAFVDFMLKPRQAEEILRSFPPQFNPAFTRIYQRQKAITQAMHALGWLREQMPSIVEIARLRAESELPSTGFPERLPAGVEKSFVVEGKEEGEEREAEEEEIEDQD